MIHKRPQEPERYTTIMPFPSGCGAATFHFSKISAIGSEPAVVLGFDTAGADPADLGALLAGWAADNLTPNMSADYTLETIDVKTTTFEDIVVVGAPGEDTSAASPPNIALLVRKGTGVPGRNQRGRSYWPGILFDNQVDNQGQITVDTLNFWTPLMDDLLTVFSTTFPDGGMALLNAAGTASQTITSYTVQAVTATQRRRLRK